MAKDRNTFAKRQREMERKRKADEKREHRARRKHQAENSPGPEKSSGPTDSPFALSPTELGVLEIFRRFRMSPGQMLCFSRSDVEAFHMPLAQLATNGLLVAEKFHGGYSLTPAGYAAMKDGP
jgi:hypothetical protein